MAINTLVDFKTEGKMGSGSTFGKIQINILVILLTDKDTEKENE